MIWIGSSSQCFIWRQNVPGNYLNVNDWYDGVNSDVYTINVEWHDRATGRDCAGILNPGDTISQPTFNCVLWSVIFES